MRTRTKEKSLAILTKELDTVFSEFIRLRDADENGTVTCFVSGERIYWRDADAAHYHVRQHMGTRWDEMNVHACSVDSNRYDPDHHEKYEKKMVEKYTLHYVIILGWRSKSLLKPTRSDLEEMIEKYKSKVAELRKLKGL
jgi:hypothetical protein